MGDCVAVSIGCDSTPCSGIHPTLPSSQSHVSTTPVPPLCFYFLWENVRFLHSTLTAHPTKAITPPIPTKARRERPSPLKNDCGCVAVHYTIAWRVRYVFFLVDCGYACTHIAQLPVRLLTQCVFVGTVLHGYIHHRYNTGLTTLYEHYTNGLSETARTGKAHPLRACTPRQNSVLSHSLLRY